MSPVLLYKRFGAVLFSHFLNRLGDEHEAMSATREAFSVLLARGDASENAVRDYLRSLEK